MKRLSSTASGLILAAALISGACGEPSSDETHPGVGVIREVDLQERQVVIDHEDIPGLMKGMTMRFDVADPELLDDLEPGQSVEFRVAYRSGSYEVTEIRAQGK